MSEIRKAIIAELYKRHGNALGARSIDELADFVADKLKQEIWKARLEGFEAGKEAAAKLVEATKCNSERIRLARSIRALLSEEALGRLIEDLDATVATQATSAPTALTPLHKPGQIPVNMPGCDKCGKFFLDCHCSPAPVPGVVDYASEPGPAAPQAVPGPVEQLAAWMIEHSFSTGHGDTVEDLLRELEWQVKELEEG